MFRRITVLTFAIVGMLASTAALLSPEEALGRLQKGNLRLSGVHAGVAEAPRLLHTASASDGQPAVYLFGGADESGYLVVSADDCVAPLLGYSDGNEVVGQGELPPQLLWWLGQYADEIGAARSGATVNFLHSAQVASSRKAIAPMLTTTWDQDAPFNNDCPAISGSQVQNGKAPTGCVATAMAQIMKYFNWPDRGSGTGNASTVSGTQLTMNLAVEFDWSNMLDSYAGNYTATQASAVAQLMKACGYAVGMNYGPAASGATTESLVEAMVENFGYDEGIRLYSRNFYGREEWESMIYDNLANVGPVYYGGSSNLGGGHAFVCDGYSTDGYYHFNWGWSGMYNGYFLLTALNPDGMGIGGSVGGFNIGQDVILGIRKPTGEPAVADPFRLSLSEAVTGVVSGSYITLSGRWSNLTTSAARFQLGAKFERVGASGASAVQYVNMGEQSLDVWYGWSSVSVPYVYASLEDGTYKVSLVTRVGSEWLGAIHAPTIPDHVLFTKSGNNYSVANAEVSQLDVSDVSLLTGLYEDTTAKMSFTVSNNSDVEIAGALAPALVNGSNRIVAEGECVFVDLLPGESVVKEHVFTLQYTASFSTGTTYRLCLYNPSDNSVYGYYGNFTVGQAPEKPVLTSLSFKLDSENPVKDKANMQFSATVRCTSGYLASPLMLAVFRESGNSYVNDSQTMFGECLFLNAGESASTTTRLDFSHGTTGVNYMAALYNPFSLSQPLASIPFTLSSESGVDATVGNDALLIRFDRASATVVATSGVEIADVIVTGIDGRTIPVAVDYDGTTATADLSLMPRGIAIVCATDASGATSTLKIVL